MKLKSEKGYTGVDIAISIVILFIFVSIISVLSYNFNSSAKAIELKSEATAIAVEEIEDIKNTVDFENVDSIDTKRNETSKKGFYKTIIVEDYADLQEGKIPGLVKRITVKIEYMFKGETKTVELSTILAKEN